MKRVLAIVCSLMLLGIPFMASAGMACARPTMPCCHGGVKMSCCDTRPDPQPAPAPGQNVTHQLSLLASITPAWTLPETPATSIHPTFLPLSPRGGAPLYARDCALLL